MKDFVSVKIKELNIALELLTYGVNVPIAAGYGILSLRAFNEKFITFMIGVTIASIVAIIFSTLVRTKILSKIIIQDLDSMNSEEQVKYKLSLVKIPPTNGVIVQIQWIIGINIVLFYYCSEYGYTWSNLTTFLMIFIALAPLNFSSHASRTDIFLKEILKFPKISSIELTKEQILNSGVSFNNFKKILATIWSNVFFILTILASLIMKGVFNDAENVYRDYYLVFIFVQSLVVIYFSTKFLAENIALNVKNMMDSIYELKKGNLDKNIKVIDYEELAIATCDLNQFKKTIQEIIGDVQNASNQLGEISKNIYQNSNEVNSEAQNQAAFTEEVSSSIEEFKLKINESYELAMNQVESLNSSSEILNNLGNEIHSTLEYSNESFKLSNITKNFSNEGYEQGLVTQNAMDEIKSESNDISGYTKIINDISDQVGLLSLNASIEAARAGKEGRGFAVVASEISKLGESTNQNSDQIQKKVLSLTKKVSNGFEKTNQLLKSFQNILDASEKTEKNMISMKENMKKQSLLKDEVIGKMQDLLKGSYSIKDYSLEQKNSINIFSQGIDNLRNGSESLAISSDALHNIAEALKKESERLENKISFFQLH
ncbi:MAG: methyl-accepting chemotaxis protein [Leptospiraceae bacterium]|nr:methyl-accepting chemotaxis protein [Leptospiraceae bacterium]